jgi:hypothetical protein
MAGTADFGAWPVVVAISPNDRVFATGQLAARAAIDRRSGL